MGTPTIAHYGTTLMEQAPPEGADLESIPMTGDLEKTDRFLRLFGMELMVKNMYPGLGRQFIYRRGNVGDVDYLEKDSFTSFSAEERPHSDLPRIGDTIFRITHADPVGIYTKLCDEGLAGCIGTEAQQAAFVAGEAPSLLIMGPDRQRYELCATQPAVADNHVVYVWTEPGELYDAVTSYANEFGMVPGESYVFHEIGTAHLIRRENPGMTLGLLVPKTVEGIAPRWTDDIFKEAGYSHFRMGSPDAAHTESVSREAFPKGGDVAFVYYRDSYLELVQIENTAAAAAE